MSPSVGGSKLTIENAESIEAWAPALNGRTWSVMFGAVAASASLASCSCMTARSPTTRRITASLSTTHSCGESFAVYYRDPPLYCQACEAQDGLCDHCAGGLARARAYLALSRTLGMPEPQ